MEFLAELLFEVYLELMMLIVPEKEMATKKYRRLAAVIAIAVLLIVFMLTVWGLVLILDHGNMLGMIPLVAAFLISAAQIGFGIYLYFVKKD